MSNLVCRGLDRDLQRLAAVHRCYYSRYADDLTFSTDRHTFPGALASRRDNQTLLGTELQRAIKTHVFEHHPDKLRLHSTHSRQRVTGVVVNEKANVPREYVRDFRAALHNWRVKGYAVAAQDFASRYSASYRPASTGEPEFGSVMRGRLAYIAHVKGWDDPVVHRLAEMLAAVHPEFSFDRTEHVGGLPTISVFTEGQSDKLHIGAALADMKSRGSFRNLRLVFPEKPKLKGDIELLKELRRQRESPHDEPVVFIFDSDNPKVLANVQVEGGGPKPWSNGVYSLVLPVPDHRAVPMCIEHYYSDDDLMKFDPKGRRLFVRNEFDEVTGAHTSGLYVRKQAHSKPLIVDQNVFRVSDRRGVALTKMQFAKYVADRTSPFDAVDFKAFETLFDALRRIAVSSKNS